MLRMDEIGMAAESAAEAAAGIVVDHSDVEGERLDALAQEVAARVATTVAAQVVADPAVREVRGAVRDAPGAVRPKR